jgi:hypothetical protein
MKTETLKALIDAEFKRHKNLTISEDRILQELKQHINDAIDLYDRDNKTDNSLPYDLWSFANPCNNIIGSEKVPYSMVCPCNPTNGGSGVCGCTMANTMVNRNITNP